MIGTMRCRYAGYRLALAEYTVHLLSGFRHGPENVRLGAGSEGGSSGLADYPPSSDLIKEEMMEYSGQLKWKAYSVGYIADASPLSTMTTLLVDRPWTDQGSEASLVTLSAIDM